MFGGPCSAQDTQQCCVEGGKAHGSDFSSCVAALSISESFAGVRVRPLGAAAHTRQVPAAHRHAMPQLPKFSLGGLSGWEAPQGAALE